MNGKISIILLTIVQSRQRQSAEDGHNKFTNVTENSYYGRFSVQKEQTKSFVIFTAQNSTRVLGLPIGGAAKTARQVRSVAVAAWRRCTAHALQGQN